MGKPATMQPTAPGCEPHATPRSQRGASLVVVMLLLLAMTIVAVFATSVSVSQETLARNERDTNIALQAAESALRDARRDLRVARASVGLAAFSVDCQSHPEGRGLCVAPAGSAPAAVWETRLKDPASSVAYGEFTGAPPLALAGSGAQPAPARYVIEALPDTEGVSLKATQAHYLYRITAIGFGAYLGTEVVLQEVVRK